MLSNRNITKATFIILNFLEVTVKKVNKSPSEINFSIFYFAQYIYNITISACSNIKEVLVKYLLFFHT